METLLPLDSLKQVTVAYLCKLRKRHPAEYFELVETWRDFLPHTGEWDCMKGEKFEQWIEREYESYCDLKRWSNLRRLDIDLGNIYKSLKGSNHEVPRT